MRQSGILAAAGIHVLENHIDRLAEDHANAIQLAEGLAGVEECEVDPGAVQTNMVYVGLPPQKLDVLIDSLKARGILVYNGNPMRLVTHLDFSSDDIEKVVGAFRGGLE